jgi:excisionase family DNA binding protein
MADTQCEWLTTGGVARLCAVKPDTVQKWIHRGRLFAQRTAGGIIVYA